MTIGRSPEQADTTAQSTPSVNSFSPKVIDRSRFFKKKSAKDEDDKAKKEDRAKKKPTPSTKCQIPISNNDAGLMRELLQAIVDNNFFTIHHILQSNLKLLLMDPVDLGIKEIESRVMTGLKFRPEKPFIMAQKGKLFSVTELLWRFFLKLKEEGCKAAKAQWVSEDKEQAENLKRDDIDPYFQSIVDTMIRNQSKVPALLKEFKEKLLPPNLMLTIGQYDYEQLLLAARQAYINNFSKLHLSQQKQYAVSVMGLLYSLHSPELASVHCMGILDFMKSKEMKISKLAKDCCFEDGKPFYPSHSTLSGIGYDSLCGASGESPAETASLGLSVGIQEVSLALRQERMTKFRELGRKITSQASSLKLDEKSERPGAVAGPSC